MAAELARVMAIINRTPDSFYDKGATFHLEKALERADAVIADGASAAGVLVVDALHGDGLLLQDGDLARVAHAEDGTDGHGAKVVGACRPVKRDAPPPLVC